MKKTLIFTFSSLLLASCGTNKSTTSKGTNEVKTVSPTVEKPKEFAETITAEDLKKHLYIYASDAFEGRETGEPGQIKAIEYLKDFYVTKGIGSPLKEYFQPVYLTKGGNPTASISCKGNTYNLGKDFVNFSSVSDGTITMDNIIYVGYGIDDPKYSDYSNIDVKDKYVIFKSGEPKNTDGTYTISGTKQSTEKWSNLQQAYASKMEVAKEKGAKGYFFYETEYFPMVVQQYKMMAANTRMALKENNTNPYFFVNSTLAKAIVPDIDNTIVNELNASITLTFSANSNDVTSHNVLAHIKGRELPNEYIVISAHLDHIGRDGDKINNGADDDGSGTVALLEIAEAFKAAADKGIYPKRSILFLHVTGEEKGLLGSDYYTLNPTISLENTVANLNIDMVGRTDPERVGDPNYIYLIGSDKLSTELHELSEEVNKDCCNVALDYKFNDENDPNRFYYRSDHYNFARFDIPIIFYFNGTHDDYHQPTDTPDKIEYDLLENRTRLIFYTAWEIANRENRIVVDKTAK